MRNAGVSHAALINRHEQIVVPASKDWMKRSSAHVAAARSGLLEYIMIAHAPPSATQLVIDSDQLECGPPVGAGE